MYQGQIFLGGNSSDDGCFERNNHQKQAQSEGLPSTKAALSQAIVRAYYQLLVWNNDEVTNPTLPFPENFGLTANENRWVPVMTKLLPPTDAIIYLIKCKCAKERC